jgi:hypothetical protein
MRVGIDFDNTIVSYDRVFAKVAVAQGLIPAAFLGNKTALRDLIRSGTPDGEARWTALQAVVYGPQIGAAEPFPGFEQFLEAAINRNVELFIVSHKSEYAAAAPGGTNLRDAARAWLGDRRIVGSGALSAANVFFESTRAGKLDRIARLRCTHFIDDLREVFDEPAFPVEAKRMLFAAGESPLPAGPFVAYDGWDAITRELFGVLARS